MNTRRRGLGKGLQALIKEEPSTVRTLPVAELRPNRLQPRTYFDDQELDQLTDSIRAQGVIQPLVVYAEDGRYRIIAGERRWRAAQRAGLDAVPVVVRDIAGGDRELLELALVENLQREDLNPLEEAEAYQALQEKFSLSQADIAQRVGKGRSTVANSLRLLKLPTALQDLVRDGQLTAGQARPLLSLEDEVAQMTLARRAVEEGLTARDLEELAAGGSEVDTDFGDKGSPKAKDVLPQDVHTAAAEEKLTRRLQTKVQIRRRGLGGQLRIHFHSEEELIRLYDHLMQREEEEP